MNRNKRATHGYTSLFNPWTETSVLHMNISRSQIHELTQVLHMNVHRSLTHDRNKRATHEYTSLFNPWTETSVQHMNISRSQIHELTQALHMNIHRSLTHEPKQARYTWRKYLEKSFWKSVITDSFFLWSDNNFLKRRFFLWKHFLHYDSKALANNVGNSFIIAPQPEERLSRNTFLWKCFSCCSKLF